MAPSPGFAPGTFHLTGERSAGLSYEGKKMEPHEEFASSFRRYKCRVSLSTLVRHIWWDGSGMIRQP